MNRTFFGCDNDEVLTPSAYFAMLRLEKCLPETESFKWSMY
jgi:hypothetical protein